MSFRRSIYTEVHTFAKAALNLMVPYPHAKILSDLSPKRERVVLPKRDISQDKIFQRSNIDRGSSRPCLSRLQD